MSRPETDRRGRKTRRHGAHGRRAAGGGALGRAQIVEAAVRIIDADGVRALNMRRLAIELGSGVMSVYRHVRDRNELLDLAFDAVIDEIELPSLGGPWEEALVAAGRQLRVLLGRHPNFVRLIGARPALGPHGLALLEKMLGFLRRGGFADVAAYEATATLMSYVVGHAVLQVAPMLGSIERSGHRYQPLLDAFVHGFPASVYPNLTAVVPQLTIAEDADFEYGLEAVVMGIRLGRTGR